MKPQKLFIVCAVALLTLTACDPASLLTSQRPVPVPTIPADLPVEVRAVLRDYDFAIGSLRAQYVDANAVGKNWVALAETERKKIIEGQDAALFAPSLRAAIGALGESDVSVQEPPAPVSGTQRFGGIGVLVDLPQPGKDRLLILSVYPNSPAERAGLRAHDSLTVVDGEPVKGDEGPAVVARLRGQPDTKVTATVSTPGKGEREVTLTRKIIDPESTITPLIAKTFPNTTIGYVVPNPANMEDMRDEVAAALRSLNNDGQLTGLVLDLRTMRDFSFPIVPMLSLFVTGDKVGSVQSRSTKAQIQISGKGVSGSQNIPMIVLVSELTTGPAESFAGLLQDVGRAKLVGATTRGRTVVVTRAQLPVSGLEMLIPSGEYVGQNGGKWFGKGVTPVILFDQKFEDYNDDSDSQLERAIAELQKQ